MAIVFVVLALLAYVVGFIRAREISSGDPRIDLVLLLFLKFIIKLNFCYYPNFGGEISSVLAFLISSEQFLNF